MMNPVPFFITGIPRTRSAWLANFFTTQSGFCHHDKMKDGWTARTIQDAMVRLHMAGKTHVGDADSGLMLIAAELVRLYPQSRWLFVHRTPQSTSDSYRKWFNQGNEYPGIDCQADIEEIMAAAQTQYLQALAAVPVSRRMEVDYADLDDPKFMRAAWDWCVPGLVWDQARYEMLDAMQVNVLGGKVKVAPVDIAILMDKKALLDGEPNGGPI